MLSTGMMRTDLQRLVDLLPRGFGGIQSVDELDVVQQVAGGTGQQLQNLVLQLSLDTAHTTSCLQCKAGHANHGISQLVYHEARLQN